VETGVGGGVVGAGLGTAVETGAGGEGVGTGLGSRTKRERQIKSKRSHILVS
jgi:hypothetical protein